LTDDPRFVIRELIEQDGIRALAVAGYSLGGNLALKLAGELGGEAPAALKAVCAVSPTMDLARCVDALDRRANLVYQWHFVRKLKARMRRKAALVPDAFEVEPLSRIWTIRRFDDVYTAPHHGFRDSADYYYRASALRLVDRIRVPTLIVSAEDDPFVPPAPFRHPLVTGNRAITVALTPHGGHCAFLDRGAGDEDGYWAEREIMRFASAHVEVLQQQAAELGAPA
jgi:predicted alpha/beta-fold hydrolase